MLKLILSFIITLSSVSWAQTYPQWVVDHVQKVRSHIYQKKRSYNLHKDIWQNEKSYRLINPSDISDINQYERVPEEKRRLFKLSVHNGRLFDSRGNEFDTSEGWAGKAIYVMLADGNIYASKRRDYGKFEYISLSNGSPVVCAGVMHVHAGKLVSISDVAFQYPVKNYYPLTKVGTRLKEMGVPLKNVSFVYFNDSVN